MTKEQVFKIYKDFGTYRRNLYIYNFCKAHSKDGEVDRGVKAFLGRKYMITRERVRQINERMTSLMEGE